MNKKYKTITTKYAQKSLNDWLSNKIFTHMLTIKLPLWAITPDLQDANNVLYKIVKHFEKSLVGRAWHKHPVHFVGFAELGKHKVWHWQLLLWAQEYTDEQLYTAVKKTVKSMKLTAKRLYLSPITHTPDYLKAYCVKELVVDKYGHLNTERFICSDLLFSD